GVDEGLIVEADLHAEAGREAADHVQEVALKRGPGVDVADRHALLDGRDAGAHGGDAVHLDQAVRALARAAHQAPAAVVLERAREHARAGGEQGRADRVAGKAAGRRALPGERDGVVAIDQLAPARAQPAHARPPGRATCSTSLRVVLRSAWNHSRQPDEWNHHSRWSPAVLSRK